MSIELGAFIELLGQIEPAFKKEFQSRVEQRTPVDTGRLQAGYFWTGETPNLIFENEAPYAGYVEFGTYRQAPHLMVNTTMLESSDILEKCLKDIGF